jgi:hypothetical protein
MASTSEDSLNFKSNSSDILASYSIEEEGQNISPFATGLSFISQKK